MPLPISVYWETQDIRQKPSARRAGKEQCLGDMPKIYRVTAIKPDDGYLIERRPRVNSRAATAIATPIRTR
jgi:hypothetical protein